MTKTKPEEAKNKVFEFIMEKKCAVKKITMYRQLGIAESAVDKACTQLRKEKILALYKAGTKTYWGIK